MHKVSIRGTIQLNLKLDPTAKAGCNMISSSTRTRIWKWKPAHPNCESCKLGVSRLITGHSRDSSVPSSTMAGSTLRMSNPHSFVVPHGL
jgi:hypothetical protein